MTDGGTRLGMTEMIVIGGGIAGMATAISAKAHGVGDILILERGPSLGGVLRQCIHHGFGLSRFREDLTGTEYARRLIDEVERAKIPCMLNTTVLSISEDKKVTAVNAERGIFQMHASMVALATGCRERACGSLLIAGERPAGIFTAGTAQRYMNLEGYLVGRRIVILGSGDIGLIVARQFVLENARVEAVVERLPYAGGSARNVRQCLDDFEIPQYYRSTVVRILGRQRITGVVVASLDDRERPRPETEHCLACDTLILSAGLIPENELAQTAGVHLCAITGGALVDDALQTNVAGIFACGNALYVHGLADQVTEEGDRLGICMAAYLRGEAARRDHTVVVTEGYGIMWVVPQRISANSGVVTLRFRPDARYPDSSVAVYAGGKRIAQRYFFALSPGMTGSIDIDCGAVQGTLRICVETTCGVKG